MYLAFEFGDSFRSPIFNGVVMTVVAGLMVSRVPTFSMKRFRIPHDYVIPAYLVIAVIVAFLTTAPWPTLSAIGILYLASIPVTVRSFNRLRREAEAEKAMTVSESAVVTAPLELREGTPGSRLPH
jgi:CDP-diacylglycerol--serine O-phosphatidyltransferase